jgi:hypothetical protein
LADEAMKRRPFTANEQIAKVQSNLFLFGYLQSGPRSDEEIKSPDVVKLDEK